MASVDPPPVDPPLGDVLELRVHGVHGTSPATMLGVGDKDVGQVAGDRLTGLYRVGYGTLPYRRGRTSSTRPDHEHVSVEAYSWGALTSGIQGVLGWVRRVLWLLLLPFALANLAHWARLEVGDRDEDGHRRDVWGARAVRLSALLLTIFFALTMSVVAVDVVGWQCYRSGIPGCSLPGPVDHLAGWSVSTRMAITSAVAMLGILLLVQLSRKSLARYEDTPPPLGAPVPDRLDTPVLRHPHLWNGRQRTQRLMWLHLAAGLCTIVAFTDLHLARVASPDRDPALFALLAALAIAVLVLAAMLTLPSHEHDVEHDPEHPEPAVPTGWVALVAGGVVVLHLLYLLGRPGGGIDQGGNFVGHNMWFIVVFVLMTALSLWVFTSGRMPLRWAVITVGVFVVGAAAIGVVYFAGDGLAGWWLAAALFVAVAYLLALNVWHYRYTHPRHRRHAWRGASASTMLAAAAWVALLFSSCLVTATADYVNGDHGISDVVSKIPKKGYTDARELTATGQVTLREATVYTDPDGGPVRVFGGTVEAARLYVQATTDRSDRVSERYSLQRGTTRVRDGATLAVPGDRVRFEDSCLVQQLPTRPLEPCTAEQERFRVGGTLTVPDAVLEIQPADGPVVVASREPPVQPVALPQVLIWLPLGQLVWLVLTALVTLGAVLLYRKRAGRAIHDWDDGFDGIQERDREVCRARRRTAGLVHRAECFLDGIGILTPPIAMAVIIFSMTGQAPWELWAPLRGVAGIALFATYLVAVGLVLIGSQMRRSESARKAVGVVWDLTTFWPRAAHPLGPPCYAERVVPELINRTRWALEAPGTDRVVLSGHSQGSLIVVAAASRLTDGELGRIRIITYGSQIRALYGRIFPAVVGPDDIGYRPTTCAPSLRDPRPDVPSPDDLPAPAPTPGSLRARLESAGGRWVNLFRRTDGLGWRVFADVDSDLDVPVPEVPPAVVGDPSPQVMTHSGYQHSHVYRTYVCGWTQEEVVPEATGTSGLPVLPPT